MVAGMLIIVVILILFILAFFLLLRSRSRYKWIVRERENFGIPQGKITYTDLNKPAEALFSARLGLVGKPDYIVEIGNKYIPVEAKSGEARRPYRNHVLQLATYCLLIEEMYNQTVPFGILTYSGGQQFRIPFTAVLREDITKTLNGMRMQLASKSVRRNHDVPARCKSCPFRKFCNQRIA
jgi:CRISPR-associated exonuclease Cas4